MERIMDLMDVNKLQQKSSQTEAIVTISPEKEQAMGDVLDRWRLNEGWNPHDELTQSFEIRSYVLSLNREGVPANAYQELYETYAEGRMLNRNSELGKQIAKFAGKLANAEEEKPAVGAKKKFLFG